MKGFATLLRTAGRRSGVVVLASLLSFGCGGQKGDVSGTVTHQDQPVKAGTVTFVAAANKEVVGSSPIADGRYSMTKLPVGPVKILVTTPSPANMRVPPKIKKLLPQGAEEKGSISVPSGDPPAPRTTVPAKYANPDESGLTYTVQPGSQEFNIELK